jgi:hypothetical protein
LCQEGARAFIITFTSEINRRKSLFLKSAFTFPINSTNEEQKSSQSKKDRTCTIANQHPGLLLKTIVNKVMHQKILAEDKLLSHTYGIKIGLKCKILSNRICKEYIFHGVEIDQPPLLAQSITCPVTELYSSICHD